MVPIDPFSSSPAVLFGSLAAASCWILVVLRSAARWEARGREWVLFVGGLAVPCSDRPGN